MNKSGIVCALAGGLTAVALSFGLGVAKAETGTHPHLDGLCYHPAFAASAPTVIVGARNPRDVSVPTVGLRSQNAYCSGPDVVLPPSYGSGPDIP
jgi:hypothetical protein